MALDRLARSTFCRLAFFALLAAVLVWPILPYAARLNEFRDVHHLFLYERAAIDTIKKFGELPLWNPYTCGGFDAVGGPQTRFVSPTILLGLAFGAERAEILTVFAFVVVGMEGMYRWLRLRIEQPLAALVIAPVFALSGHFAVAYFRGWIQFFGFELVPWIMFGITLAARRRAAGLLIASLAFATVLGFGGPFAAPLIAIAAALEGTRAILEQPRAVRARAAVMVGATALFMLLVAWVRLWPIMETMLSAPRIMAGLPGHSPTALLRALGGRLAVVDGNTQFLGSFYVGFPFALLALLGSRHPKGILALLFVGIFCWLALGHQAKLSSFALIRELPLVGSIRYPERFLWLAIFFASEAVGHATDMLLRLGEGRRWRAFAWAMVAGVCTFTVASETMAFHRTALDRALGFVTERDAGDFHQARGNRWTAVHFESMGIGSLGCYETHRLAGTPLLRGDLPAEEYLAPASRGLGTVKRLAWSPNRIALHVDVKEPARILVNQNWAPGWRTSVGSVVSNEGLLAIDVPAGVTDLELRYRPWTTFAGAGVSAAALVALVWLVHRQRRGRDLLGRRGRVTFALALVLPMGLAAAAYAKRPEPRLTHQTPTNPNGTLALVPDAVATAPGQTAVGASFAPAGGGALALEASRVLGPDIHRSILVDLFLRRRGDLAHATTMFVHVRHESHRPDAPRDKDKDKDKERDFYNADHQVVGGSFFLSDIPEGVLVHDAFGVHLDKALPGRWTVWVAFGAVGGKGGNAPITTPGATPSKDGFVQVGSFTVTK